MSVLTLKLTTRVTGNYDQDPPRLSFYDIFSSFILFH